MQKDKILAVGSVFLSTFWYFIKDYFLTALSTVVIVRIKGVYELDQIESKYNIDIFYIF